MSNKPSWLSSETPYLGWRLLSISVVGVMVVGTIASLWFMYKNIYSTIQNSTVIVSLSDSTSWQTIDLVTFQTIEARLKEKEAPQLWPSPLRNMFVYQAASSTLPNP